MTAADRIRAALDAIVKAREENANPGGSHDLVEAALETAEIQLGGLLEEVDRAR